MNSQQRHSQALALSESVTASGIIEWLAGWRTVEPDHSQHSIKDEQILIGEMALEIQRQH